MTMWMMYTTTIPPMLMMMSKMMKKNKKKTKIKSLPFECGFSTPNKILMPMSLQFIMITIMFLIFDIEICILLSLNKSTKLLNPSNWTMMTIMFMIIMLISLMTEWMSMAMKWNQ